MEKQKNNEFISMVRISEEVSRHGGSCPKTKSCKYICSGGELFPCEDCKRATALINANYGDVKAAVREFAERLKKREYSVCIGGKWSIEVVSTKAIDELLKEYEE